MQRFHARIAVVYYSATGNVHRLALALGQGAEDSGCEVRVRRVAETAGPGAVASNPRWAEHVALNENAQGPELVTLEDVEWADGVALGSPTRFGGPAAQLKAFLDTTGGLWASHSLQDKAVTAFTSASTDHGGLESTVLAMLNIAYHWGSLIVPTGYVDADISAVGNPYGSSWVSRKGAGPDEVALGCAYSQGRRLADIVSKLGASARSPQ